VCDELTVGIVTKLQYDIRYRLQKIENKDMGSCPLIHPNYFSRLRVRVWVVDNRKLENNSGELTEKYQDMTS